IDTAARCGTLRRETISIEKSSGRPVPVTVTAAAAVVVAVAAAAPAAAATAAAETAECHQDDRPDHESECWMCCCHVCAPVELRRASWRRLYPRFLQLACVRSAGKTGSAAPTVNFSEEPCR